MPSASARPAVVLPLSAALLLNSKRKLKTEETQKETVAIQYQEILAQDTFVMTPSYLQYWQEVKQEINKLWEIK